MSTFREPQVLNIPLMLLHQEKSRKLRLELLAFSLIIKLVYKDSRLRHADIKTVQSLLHCGKDTAKRLLQASKHSPLFRYNAYNDTLLAKNFKKKFIKKCVNSYGKEYYSMYAVKLDRRNYTLRNLVKELRKLLLLNIVNGCEWKNRFNYNEVKSKHYTTLFVPKVALTQEWIAKKIGVKDRTTVQRLVKELEAEHRLVVTHTQLEFLTACNCEEAINDALRAAGGKPHAAIVQDRKTGALYCIEANRYMLGLTAEKRRFTNIILNHSKRWDNNKKGNVECHMMDIFD